METLLRKYQFDGIWHFTDRTNLELIQEHKGLLSLGELESRGIEIPSAGGNEWSHDADKSGAVIIEAEEAKDQIDFEALFAYMDWTDQEVQARRRVALKSEILVPGFVPIEKILSIKNG